MFSLAMIRPYLQLIVVAGILAGALALYLMGKEAGVNETLAKQTKEAELVATTRGAAMRGIADGLAQQKIYHTTIRQKVEERIIEKPVYRACQHDDDQLRRINEALAGMRGSSAGVLVLPAATPTAD